MNGIVRGQDRMMRRAILLGAGAMAAGVPRWLLAQAQGMEQVSLSIGINNYKSVDRLVNAVPDARLMHETFARLGAHGDLFSNLETPTLKRAIGDFVGKMKNRNVGIAWFFFSGHGVVIEGKNLLLGTDVTMQSPATLRSSGVDLDSLRGMLEQVKPRIAVVIVDACRNNPFQTRGLERRDKGLVPDAWDGTLVAYSTAEFTKALDWSDKKNGPYATALSAVLSDPHARDLEDVFRVVQKQVFDATGKKQIPGFYSELRSQVWLDAGKVSLRSLPQTALAQRGNSTTGRSVALRASRADLVLDDQYEGTSGGEWATLTHQLEIGAPRMDGFEAADTIKRANQHNASDRDLCLAGLLLEAGDRSLNQGVQKNRGLAAKFYERAAMRGYVPAQTLLGELAYERQDYVQSYKWLSVAARSGYGRPKMDLAQLTGEGRGTPQDTAKAVGMMIESVKSLPEFSGEGLEQAKETAKALQQMFGPTGVKKP
ncbi:caspase family protein [Herbaspirillum lusitanum]|uniref:Caspase family protein n=1 Tax=Herbaspirillum lusitanum TaxID=213312 RepID=A0ABW9A7P6_9BURK